MKVILLGIITTAIRLFFGYDGCCVAILLVCLFTPFIDLFASHNRGPIISSKMILSYVLLAVIFIGLSALIVYKSTDLSFIAGLFNK